VALALLRDRPVQHRLALASAPSPVAALAALRPLGAALLEGRGEHPENRAAYVAFHPRAELWATGERAFLAATGQEPQPLPGRPFDAIARTLEAIRGSPRSEPAFQGGWVGFLGHEFSAGVLGTPVAQPLSPARPPQPTAHLRLYADVLAIDRGSGGATLLANDWGDEDPAGPQRLAGAARRLATPPNLAAPARGLDAPVRTLTRDEFESRVADLQALVRDGDCFQVNLTTSLAYPWASPPAPGNLLSLYDAYAAANPGAWGGYYEAPGATLLSSSPECLADLHGGRLRLRPIAGTRPRGRTKSEDHENARSLGADPKERAEHAMLVDLARNDAARVCDAGTVHVPNFAGVERYRHVMHLVSEVEGRARGDLTIDELLRAVFPGGTVTGAPKRRAVQRIAEFEAGARGAYTGALGYVSVNGSTQWNLLIRTLVATPSHLVAHAGCGIVADSRPRSESDELEAKARAQVEAALGHATPAPATARCGHVDPGAPWRPTTGPPLADRRLLLIDHDDSFVHNLADYCRRLGAQAVVRSAHEPAEAAWAPRPTHMILSPGPGRPRDFPETATHLKWAETLGVPVLGVCLGHQAMAERAGARIDRHPETVHGRASRVTPTEAGSRDPVFAGWNGPAARYHSLVANQLPPALESLAELEDGTCMALRVRGRPQWGLQFHPESLLTHDGWRLLRAFLAVDPR